MPKRGVWQVRGLQNGRGAELSIVDVKKARFFEAATGDEKYTSCCRCSTQLEQNRGYWLADGESRKKICGPCIMSTLEYTELSAQDIPPTSTSTGVIRDEFGVLEVI